MGTLLFIVILISLGHFCLFGNVTPNYNIALLGNGASLYELFSGT
jgi:hypothetical protein